MNAVDELKEKEVEIKTLQEKKSRLEGKKDQLLSDLKEKFDVATLGDGQTLLKGKRSKKEEIDNKMEVLLEEMDGIIGEAG